MSPLYALDRENMAIVSNIIIHFIVQKHYNFVTIYRMGSNRGVL